MRAAHVEAIRRLNRAYGGTPVPAGREYLRDGKRWHADLRIATLSRYEVLGHAGLVNRRYSFSQTPCHGLFRQNDRPGR